MSRFAYDFNQPSGTMSLDNLRDNFRALHQMDMLALRPRAASPVSMSVEISGSQPGTYYSNVHIGDEPLIIATGDSPALVAPAGNPRIDILSIDASGDFAWTSGDEAASPFPAWAAVPQNNMPVALVYSKTTMTTIVNYEDKDSNPNEGYIYADARPFMKFGTSTKWTASGDNVYYSDGNVGVGVHNPVAELHVVNAGTGTGLRVNQDGIVSATNHGLYVRSEAAQTSDSLMQIDMINASSSKECLKIANSGSGQSIYLNQIGNGIALEVDNDGTDKGIYVHCDAALAANKRGIEVYSNAVNLDNANELVRIRQDNAGATSPPLHIHNDGSGKTINTNSGGGTSAHLTAAGVWTDASCCHVDKEDAVDLQIKGFIKKLKGLKLFEYTTLAEKYQRNTDGSIDKLNIRNNQPKRHKGYIIDDPTTPTELIEQEGGKSAASGVNFLLCVCKELVSRIEKLEKKVT